jgi:hypothetical protein
MEPYAKVIADSVSPAGRRLTTFEVCFHRFVLAEFNTHRVFCLAGDSVLEFNERGRRGPRVHRMTVADFVDKWEGGARRIGAFPKRTHDLTWIAPGGWYPAKILSERLGYSKGVIHSRCRDGDVEARKGVDGRSWEVLGSSFVAWRESVPEHTRFTIRDRLSSMQIRQFNEDTGDIQTSRVIDAVYSGRKEVFEIRADRYRVAGSKDHLVMTTRGYRRIEEIVPGSTEIVVRKYGKREDELLDPLRLKKFDGRWRSNWQTTKRKELFSLHGGCQECGSTRDLAIHHVIPVCERPDLVFEDTNIQLLCRPCHIERHRHQSWRGGSHLYGASVVVDEVVSRGIEDTYDLSIAGPYPNFIANGVVVHNSRNSASSRAIPVERQLARIDETPALPLEWPSEKPGMQGGVSLGGSALDDAKELFDLARLSVVLNVRAYLEDHPDKPDRLHKSLVNRLMEPYQWHVAAVTSTAWENFFRQRVSPLAQPEIRVPAEMMLDAYQASIPTEIDYGDYHLPYTRAEDVEQAWDEHDNDAEAAMQMLVEVSSARCARVSYMTQDGRRDLFEDLRLYRGDHTRSGLITAEPMHACYDDATEVLTDRGFVRWAEVDQADRLGCWDNERGSLVYELPRTLHRFDYDGLMYEIDHPKINLLVTPNHQMWVSRRSDGRSPAKWREPYLERADTLGELTATRYFKSAPLVDQPDEKLDWLIEDVEDTHALLMFVGFFLGDGYAARPHVQNPNTVRFRLRKQRKIAFLRDITAKIGWSLRELACDTYAISVPGIGSAFRSAFYDVNGEKTLPARLRMLNQRQAQSLLMGSAQSDGSLKRRTWSYDSTSVGLLDALEIVALHAGLSWTRMKLKNATRPGRTWRLAFHTLSRPRINHDRLHIDTHMVPYEGPVWCASTRTGVLVVRRNGQVVLCGNSPLEHVATPAAWNEHTLIMVSNECAEESPGGAVRPLNSKEAAKYTKVGRSDGYEVTLPLVGNFLGWQQHRLEIEMTRPYQFFA